MGDTLVWLQHHSTVRGELVDQKAYALFMTDVTWPADFSASVGLRAFLGTTPT